MVYSISYGKEVNVKTYKDYTEIVIPNLSALFFKTSKEIIIDMLKQNKIVDLLSYKEEIFNFIVECIVNDYQKEELTDYLTDNHIPLFSLAINIIENYKKFYKLLCNFKDGKAKITYIDADKTNIDKTLLIAITLSGEIIINANSISLYNYKEILDNYNVDAFKLKNIKINYQNGNSPISIPELNKLANLVYDITYEIKKSNMSQLEQIMYVYDSVKKREYKKSTDLKEQRDVDKVITGDKAVCSGFSNLFNALLKALDIPCYPVISKKINHQRSMVYVKDSKYNIDGIYFFDPTWDRVRAGDLNFYDYFALSFTESKKKFPTEFDSILSYSIDDLIDIFDVDDGNTIIKILDNLSTLKKLTNIDIDNLDDFLMAKYDSEVKEKMVVKYLILMSKIKAKPLDYVTFSKLLYNVRKNEYYNDNYDMLDIDDIKECVIQRYVNLKKGEFKEEANITPEQLLFRLLKYDMDLSDILDSNFESFINSKVSVNRDIKNIKLLKLLRKRSEL